jgi:hypothetical protein
MKMVINPFEKYEKVSIFGNGSNKSEKLKSRLNSRYACYHSVQILSPPPNPLRLLSVVLYGCETWSLTLSWEHRLRAEKNIWISWGRREEIWWRWLKLHNEFHNSYFSPNSIKVIKSRIVMGAACSRHGRDEKYIQNFGQEIWRHFLVLWFYCIRLSLTN